jgi:hypothetical protein
MAMHSLHNILILSPPVAGSPLKRAWYQYTAVRVTIRCDDSNLDSNLIVQDYKFLQIHSTVLHRYIFLKSRQSSYQRQEHYTHRTRQNGPLNNRRYISVGTYGRTIDKVEKVKVDKGFEKEVRTWCSRPSHLRGSVVQRIQCILQEETESVPRVDGEHHSLSTMALGSVRVLSAMDINGLILE